MEPITAATTDQRATPSDDVAARYGPTRGAKPSRARIVVLAAVALLVAVCFVWVSVEFSDRDARWRDVSFRSIDDDTAEATFEVFADTGTTLRCVVRAVDAELADVGRVEVDVGPVVAGAARETVVIRTLRPAVGASVGICVLLPEQLP